MARASAVAPCLLALISCASARSPEAPGPAETASPSAPPETPETHEAPLAAAPVVPDAGASPERACPAPEHGAHCLWIATQPPNPFRAKHVTARLKKDGFEAIADGDRIIVHAADDALSKLFEANVEHGLRAASSSDHMRCVAVLPDGARLASRYAGEVGDYVLDDPTCEL